MCSTVEPAKYAVGFPKGVYHSFDCRFYFFDTMANAANRIEHYLADNKAD